MQETRVRSLGWEDPLEQGMATTPVFLPGDSPWTEEPGGLQSTGSHTTEATRLQQQQQKGYHMRKTKKYSSSSGILFFTLPHVAMPVIFKYTLYFRNVLDLQENYKKSRETPIYPLANTPCELLCGQATQDCCSLGLCITRSTNACFTCTLCTWLTFLRACPCSSWWWFLSKVWWGACPDAGFPGN